MHAPPFALQPDLFAEATDAAASSMHRDTETSTAPAPVLYRCRPCERRTKRPHLWRRTLSRTTARTAYAHPAFAQQIALTEIAWTLDGRTHAGTHPPTDRCPSCRLPTTGQPIRGQYHAARQCDARCMYAKGPDCVCSCGGKNHGIGHHRL